MLGEISKGRLGSCHHDIQRFVEAVAAGIDNGECPGVHDLTVLCGYRGEKEQNEAFERKTSKLQWPHSKHNSTPSNAVDMAPYPLDWSVAGLPAFRALRKYALATAEKIGVKIRIISWDWPHYEMMP